MKTGGEKRMEKLPVNDTDYKGINMMFLTTL